MNALQLSFSQIQPYIRFAQEMDLPKSVHAQPVSAKDHRLFFILNGSAILQINDFSCDIQPGSLICLPSGTTYQFRADSHTALQMIVINFDFTDAFRQLSRTLPLQRADAASKEDVLETITFTDAPELNQPAVIPSFTEVLPYLRQITEEFRMPDRFSDTMLRSLMVLILNHMLRRLTIGSGRKKDDSCQRILEYIQEHYTEDLTNIRLAGIFNYHPNYISSLVAAGTGLPLHRYLLQIRIRQALFLLKSTDLPVAEIAHRTGFQDVSYFSQYFKKSTGSTPGAFRNGI